MISETYFLPQHVFVCSTTRYVVILDLIADKYICVQRRVLDGLAPCLSGWIPLPGKVAESSTSHTDGANVIETLLAQGILTKGGADAKLVAPAPIAVANAALAPVSKQARSVIRFRYLRSFVIACVSADRALRKQPLASVVARTAARRLQYDRGAQSFDKETTSKLVAAFNGLRWWYPRMYVCMFDSLALLEFLAQYRLYPRWVFGVTPEPFQAHCWLQEEGLVLNDSVEHVSTYVPVMAT